MGLSTTGTIVLFVIFTLAALLIALPRMLGRRERKRRGRDDLGETDAIDGEDAPAKPARPLAASSSDAVHTARGLNLSNPQSTEGDDFELKLIRKRCLAGPL